MRHRWLAALAVVALAFSAGCSSGKTKKSSTGATDTSEVTDTTASATAVTGEARSPERDSVQGVSGTGMFVDLVFRSNDPDVLKAQPRVNTATAKAGRNPAFPGLVVTLSTTDASLGGPSANLANLFQLVAVSKAADGSTVVGASWSNSKASFGVDTDTQLDAFVVNGDAPDTVPSGGADLDVVSNMITVPFHVAGPKTTATTEATTATSRGTATTRGTRTTTTIRRTTTSRRPATTTTRASATSTTV